MILYNHTYNKAKNEIEITPVEVTETEKTFRATERELFFYRKVINKNEIDELNTEYGLHMASLSPRPDAFKSAIINFYEGQHEIALTALNVASNNLEKAKQCKIPVTERTAANSE